MPSGFSFITEKEINVFKLACFCNCMVPLTPVSLKKRVLCASHFALPDQLTYKVTTGYTDVACIH